MEKICVECPNLSTYPSIGLIRQKIMGKRIFSNIDITLVVPTDKMFGEVKKVYFLRIKKFIKYPTE